MADAIYKELSDEFTALKHYRENSGVETRMRSAVQLVVPKYGVFGTDPVWPDVRFDTIGTECVSLLGEGFFSNVSPSSSPWSHYISMSAQDDKDNEKRKLCERLTKRMEDVFARSTYYASGPEWFQLFASMPVSVIDVREDKETGRVICTVEHPRAVYIKTDARNNAVAFYIRKFLTADQVAREWGEEKLDDSLGAEYKRASTKEYEFIEVCRLRKGYNNGSPIATDWRWGEYVFRQGDSRQQLYFEGGAKTCPKIDLRWGLRGNEPYAYTPVDDATPDIRTCNQMARTMLVVKEKQAEPAEWYPEEGKAWSSDPRSKNYYRDPSRRMYKDDITGYTFDHEAHDFFQQRVRKALKVDSFLMLMHIDTKMTAREVVERKREGMSVTAAQVGRVEVALDKLHWRFLQIEYDAGRLEEFAELFEGDGDIKIEHSGPLSMLSKQVYVEQSIVGALNIEALVLNLWPNEKYRIKPSVLTENIWKAEGSPADALLDEKQYAKVMQEVAAQQQAQMQAAIMQQMAGKADPMRAPERGSPAEAMVGG
jgi:hypothetical protein